LKEGRVVGVSDVNFPTHGLRLRVAAQAEIGVTRHQQFLIDRAMGLVAGDAAFPQGIMGKYEGTRLIPVALGAIFIRPRHRESARRFEDIAPMRVMTLHTVHLSLNHRMVLRQRKGGMYVQMTLKAGGRVMAGVDDEFGAAAGLNVFAAGTVAGFATRLARHGRFFVVKTSVRAGGKFADDFHVTIFAGGVSHVMGVGNREGSHHRARFAGAGNDQQGDADRQAGGKHQCECAIKLQ
jgi:hypothetical protein